GVDMGDVLDYVRANDLGTAAMLRAMHEARFSGRIVLASSMAVYGEGTYRCPDHGRTRPEPRTPARLAGGRFEPTRPDCGRALAAGESPRVFEDGGQRRDFVHVSDVVAANVLALSAVPAVTGQLNVASGEPHTVGEMAEALASAFGPAAPRPVVTGEYRAGDVRHVFASPARAADLLGVHARAGVVEGVHVRPSSALSSTAEMPRSPAKATPRRATAGDVRSGRTWSSVGLSNREVVFTK